MAFNRRDFIKKSSLLGLTGLASSLIGKEQLQKLEEISTEIGAETKFVVPPLSYSYSALEPFIDTKTMEIHHGKHHQAYVDKLNSAISTHPIEGDLEQVFKTISKHDVAVRNNGGGHYNHSLFWQSLAPATGQMPSGKLLAAINAKFGSMEQFKEAFNTAAKGVFGSGWVWLLTNNKGDMWIQTTPNQDNPLMKRLVKRTGKPLLMLDVWEHAYYLKYQNKRADYIDAFWKVINWQEVAKRI